MESQWNTIDLEVAFDESLERDFSLRQILPDAVIVNGRPTPEQSEPVNLTGCLIILTVRDADKRDIAVYNNAAGIPGDPDADPPILPVPAGTGIVIISPEEGYFAISIADVTAFRNKRDLTYSLVLQRPDGNKTRLWQGSLKVKVV